MNNRKLVIVLFQIIILSVFLTGFSAQGVEFIRSDVRQIGQDPTPPPPQEPVQPPPENQVPPPPEQPGGKNQIIIQLPWEEDATNSTQYFGAGLSVGCLIGLGILLVVLIGVFIGRSSKSDQVPPPPPTSDNQPTQY